MSGGVGWRLFHLQKCGSGQYPINKSKTEKQTLHLILIQKLKVSKNKHQTNNRIMVTRAWEGQIEGGRDNMYMSRCRCAERLTSSRHGNT